MDDLTRLKILLEAPKPSTKNIEEGIASCFNSKHITLRPCQVEYLAGLVQYRRVFGSIGVGHGKTLISILASVVTRSYRALLFVPSNLVGQLTKIDIPQFEKWFHIKLDWCSLQDKSQHQRRNLMNKHRVTIFPYSILSTEDTTDLLELSNADLIICDECHYLKNFGNAKITRFLDYIDKYTDCSLCFMSGTIIRKSIMDYHHLITRGLKHLSPLPHDNQLALDIDELISYKNFKKVDSSKFLCKLAPQLKAGYGEYLVNVEKAREFMTHLFDCSPATVRTENQSVDCSLFINPIEMKKDPAITEHLKKLGEEWETPDGDLLEDYLSLTNASKQISSGFYYRLYWKEDTEDWQIDHHKKRVLLVNTIKKWIRYRHRIKLDTLGLVEKALERGDPEVHSLQQVYKDWKDSIKGIVQERSRESIWLSDYKIREAKKWALENKKGIIWYEWDAVGLELAQAIPNSVHCPAEADIELLRQNKILICSFAHAEGKNLQHLSKNLLLDIPSSGALMEQLIGRTHRQGQEADCVEVDILVANPEDKELLKTVYRQSKNLNTIDKKQKFILADWGDAYEYKTSVGFIDATNDSDSVWV
jgi:hypothetical protein